MNGPQMKKLYTENCKQRADYDKEAAIVIKKAKDPKN